MQSVEDLDVFKLAHQLALKTYLITRAFSKEETFSLVDQMRRAASVRSSFRRFENSRNMEVSPEV
jgi:23S rRNA-intervening sequence protein